MAESKKAYFRWIPVLAGIAVQLCLGTAYIWGVFQPKVVELGWAQTDAALTYSLLLGVLTFGSMVGGKIQDRVSPTPVIIIGGVILSIGFFLAGLGTPEMPWVLWLTYGVMGGFGMGMTYSTTIAVCQKWFPDKRGLITGIIVSALGFGGLVFTPVANALMESAGVGRGIGAQQISSRLVGLQAPAKHQVALGGCGFSLHPGEHIRAAGRKNIYLNAGIAAVEHGDHHVQLSCGE